MNSWWNQAILGAIAVFTFLGCILFNVAGIMLLEANYAANYDIAMIFATIAAISGLVWAVTMLAIAESMKGRK